MSEQDDERGVWSPGSGIFKWLLCRRRTPAMFSEKRYAQRLNTMNTAVYHPEMIEWVHEQGASYNCLDCGGRLILHTDVVIYEGRPAYAVELTCRDDDCGFVTRGMLPTAAFDFGEAPADD